MNKKDAIKNGFTHYGDYFGLPIYLDLSEGDCPVIECKYEWMNFMFDIISHVEGFMRSILHPDHEPVFQFRIRGEL